MKDERRASIASFSSFILHPSSFLSRYGPLAVWLGVIFFASTGSFSASNTSRIVGPLLTWLFPDITPAQLLQAHFFVRKTAHFSEYAVLGLLAARASLTSSRTLLRRRWLVLSLALVIVCASLDEYIQSHNPARTGTPYDSLIDIAGGAFALALIRWRRTRRGRVMLAASPEKPSRPQRS